MLIPIFANEYTTVLNASSESNGSGSSNVIDIYSNFQNELRHIIRFLSHKTNDAEVFHIFEHISIYVGSM